MANDRIEAIGRANLEAEAAAAASMREEADRLLEEHRDRTAQLQEEMKVLPMHRLRPKLRYQLFSLLEDLDFKPHVECEWRVRSAYFEARAKGGPFFVCLGLGDTKICPQFSHKLLGAFSVLTVTIL